MAYRTIAVLFPLLAAILMAGCGADKKHEVAAASASDAEKFLSWSMDKNAALKSYRSHEKWVMKSDGGDTSAETRDISLKLPNKYRVVTFANEGKFCLTAACDGVKLIEYTNDASQQARSYDAPPTIADVTNTMQMKHPMFNGSLLYQFFAGSQNFNGLVNKDMGPITFGADEKASNGEEARLVKFYGIDKYGNVEALIGKKTGIVYRLKFDSEGLVKAAKEDPQTAASAPKNLETTEVFSNIETDIELPDGDFHCAPPHGTAVQQVSAVEPPPPPLELGKPAPDFEVAALDGHKLKLSSLKGKIVMIDFWATWCPPCRKGLPTTDRMYKKYGHQGLRVLTVSSEDVPTVRKFILDNKYSFPAYVDPSNAAASQYKIDGIPCIVIVDAKGNLSSYTAGLEPEDMIVANLRRAGLKG